MVHSFPCLFKIARLFRHVDLRLSTNPKTKRSASESDRAADHR